MDIENPLTPAVRGFFFDALAALTDKGANQPEALCPIPFRRAF